MKKRAYCITRIKGDCTDDVCLPESCSDYMGCDK